MTIFYKVIAKLNPSNRAAAPKFYASVNNVGKRDNRFIAKQIAERSSLNQMDVLSVIEGFLQIVPETLADGYKVDLGEFGTFGLTTKSKGAEKEEAFNASMIESTKVNFRPGKLFKNVLNNADFEKIHVDHPVETTSE